MNAEMLIEYLKGIKEDGQDFFIEAEGKEQHIINFIMEYNSKYTPNISEISSGIIKLKEDANKWALELRLYIRKTPPKEIKEMFKFSHNIVYKDNYTYRMNNNTIVRKLFDYGFRLGLN